MAEKKKSPAEADADTTEVRVVEPPVQADAAKARADVLSAKVGEAPDPFDPERLRVSQDFAVSIGVKKLTTTVPVRKPSKEWWITTHPSEKYRIETAVLELKEDREIYLVDRPLWSELMTEATFSPRLLITTINRQNVLFLWPIRMPNSEGRIDDWNCSAMEAASRAQGKWVRVAANMNLGAYDIYEAQAPLTPPEWPALPFNELLRVAFRDKFITSMDHPILKKLRGEV